MMYTLSKERRLKEDSQDSRDNNNERLLTKKKKSELFAHHLSHERCNLCSTSFSSSFCNNCCLPICREFIDNSASHFKSKKNNQDQRQPEDRLSPFHSSSLQSIIVGSLWNSSLSSTSRPKSPLTPITRSRTPTSSAATTSDNNRDNFSMSNFSITASAPTIGHELFDNEENSDVIFLVGPDKNDLWRFPGHTEILKNVNSVYFRDISTGFLNNNNKEIRIDWCDPKTFQVILKYAYTEELNVKTVPEILKLFVMSVRFSMLSLSKHCLTFLKSQCNDQNVLVMLKFFQNYFELLKFEKQDPTDPKTFQELYDSIAELILIIFDVIDRNGSKIIEMDEFSMLNRDLVAIILSRDTLNVDSEIDVYKAICRWSDQQCKQQRKEMNDKNKRDLLGDLIYQPRYLIMNLDDFMDGPYKEEKLNPDEKELFLKKLASPKNEIDQIKLSEMISQYRLDIPRRYYNEEEENRFVEKKFIQNTREMSFHGKLSKSMSHDNGFDDKNNNKKRSVPKKIMKGLGEFMIFIIKVLD